MSERNYWQGSSASSSAGLYEERLRFLRERCKRYSIRVDFSDADFWWYCFAERAAFGLAWAGRRDVIFALVKVPPKKRKAGADALADYVLSKFPNPGVRKRFEELARAYFPECFGEEDPRDVLERVAKTNRDVDAARFLLRARGADAPLPEGFDEASARLRHEICVREYALRVVEGSPEVVMARKAVEKAVRDYRSEVVRLREKLERGAKVMAEKATEVSYYKDLAKEALQKMREMEEFYRAELESLQRRVRELERELVRHAAREPAPLPLDGARVVVMCDPARAGDIAAALKETGAEAVCIDGVDESFDIAVVRSADLAVVAADYGRHAALYKLKSEARRCGVRVVTVPAGTAAQIAAAARRHFGLETL